MVTAGRNGHRWVPPTALAALGVLLATLAAGLVITRIYSGVQLPVLLVGAAAGSVAFTLLFRLVRTPPVLCVVGALAGLVACLVGAGAALRVPGSGPLGAVLADALVNSGARILTSAIPIGPAPDTVLLPVAVTWLAGSIGAVLLGPLRSDQRPTADEARRQLVLAALPPLALLVTALVFVGPNGGTSYPYLALFVLGEAMILAVTGRPWAAATVGGPDDPDLVRAGRIALARRVLAAVVVLAVVGVGAVTVGPVVAGLSGRQPVDPRSYVVPPNKHLDQLNPLGMLAAWADDPKIPLLAVRSSRPERIRWATLSTFNGVSWEPDRQYRAAGSVLPAPAGSTDPTVTVQQRISVGDLTGGWLPTAPVAREVKGARIGYDAESGSVLALDGLSNGMTYQVTSAVPVQNPSQLAAATVPTGPEFARYLQVPPGIPDQLARLAQTTASAGTPYRRALQLEQYLQQKYQYWSKAPSGNGYVTLAHFLDTTPGKGGGRGISEQFASAFAVMARVTGLPSRVVVGFHAGQPKGGDRYLISSGDAYAWAEIYLEGHGWVAFDPTPKAGKGATPPDENTPQAKSQQQQKSQQLDQAQPTPTATVPPTPRPNAASGAGGGLPPAAIGGGAAALLLLLLVAAIPLLRWRRTRRRLDLGPPPARVLGAWAEVRDTLRLAGDRPASSVSAGELVRAAAAAGPQRPDARALPDLEALARHVNAVAFGGAAAGPHLVQDGDALRAAGVARRYHRALRNRFSPVRRLLWRLDPRPLFWRR